jgi:hypothetical protein
LLVQRTPAMFAGSKLGAAVERVYRIYAARLTVLLVGE